MNQETPDLASDSDESPGADLEKALATAERLEAAEAGGSHPRWEMAALRRHLEHFRAGYRAGNAARSRGST